MVMHFVWALQDIYQNISEKYLFYYETYIWMYF